MTNPFPLSLNTIELTKDGGMAAAGFADSSVKLWDLKKDHARIFGTSTATRYYFCSFLFSFLLFSFLETISFLFFYSP